MINRATVFYPIEGKKLEEQDIKNEQNNRKKNKKDRPLLMNCSLSAYRVVIVFTIPDEELLKNLPGFQPTQLLNLREKPSKHSTIFSSLGLQVFTCKSHAISKMDFLNKNLKEQSY